MFAKFVYLKTMVRGKILTIDEKIKITKLLSGGKTTLEVVKIIKRDHRTVKKYVNEFYSQAPHKAIFRI